MTARLGQEDYDLSAKAIYNSLFEQDILIPRPKADGSLLPPHARVAVMTVDSALRDMTQRDNERARLDAVEWVRDHDGWICQRMRGFTYPITFDEAIHCGYVGLDPEILGPEILKRLGNGTLTRTSIMQYRIASGSQRGTQRMAQ